jgi:ankyrin repeat protein
MWLINTPGIDTELQHEDGLRAIHHACEHKNNVIFDELLKHQADLEDISFVK